MQRTLQGEENQYRRGSVFIPCWSMHTGNSYSSPISRILRQSVERLNPSALAASALFQ